MNIRVAVPEDAPAIAKVHVNTWRSNRDTKSKLFAMMPRMDLRHVLSIGALNFLLLVGSPCWPETHSSGTTQGHIGSQSVAPKKSQYPKVAGDDWLVLPLMAGMIAALAFAPPVLVPLSNYTGKSEGPPMRRARLTLDGGVQTRIPYVCSTQVFDAFFGHLYAGLENNYLPIDPAAEIFTVSTGYLFSKENAYGGVMIGYRGGRYARSGVELGLPLFLNLARGFWRIQPSYLFLSNSVQYSFRTEMEFALIPKRFFAGAFYEHKWLKQSLPFNDVAGLSLSTVL